MKSPYNLYQQSKKKGGVMDRNSKTSKEANIKHIHTHILYPLIFVSFKQTKKVNNFIIFIVWFKPNYVFGYTPLHVE
jgi:hypothetical protein